MADQHDHAELARLAQDEARTHNWKRWGPYLSERQWGTVREDYSADGDCWNYLPHDHARSRAYRWGEDGLLGITDRECRLCFSLALWNGRDPILKERLFGLTGPEGNHGEDVKECYFYLDSTPTHSYMKALYKYPQAAFPYADLVRINGQRGRQKPEYELLDTGVFNENRYFDVSAEYAKAGPDDILIRINLANRGPQAAPLHFLPTLWFRNVWSWGCTHEGCELKPRMWREHPAGIAADHVRLGMLYLVGEDGVAGVPPDVLFTENESNLQRLYGSPNPVPYVKDAFHRYVVNKQIAAVNPKSVGTKAAFYYELNIPAGANVTLRFRLSPTLYTPSVSTGEQFDAIFAQRKAEADAFYEHKTPKHLSKEQRAVARQAYAGLLWSKQFYHYVVEDWLKGDPEQPKPPAARMQGRNADWGHLFSRDILSMPDKWEYPWFAAWDLAFHMIPMARIDPQFAKEQLLLILREWYMHPNGQIPAYEFSLGDVNPPVHAWACWRVYKMTGQRGQRDRLFLERVFQKLMINFTWWVNRKDVSGKHIFSGGFLGLDNIGVFDRSKPLPTGGTLDQADGTAWMAFYCSTMLAMAMELASEDPAYEDVASKFFEHFVAIVDAMNTLGGTGLWDESDGFYYDRLQTDHWSCPLRIRSMVGLIPLFACEILEHEMIKKLPGFAKRMEWFLKYRNDLARNITFMETEPLAGPQDGGDRVVNINETHAHYLLAVPSRARLERILRYVTDEAEFLSPFGIRSLSKVHKNSPFVFRAAGQEFRVDYVPAESDTGLFGGNSNWRGPIWFPVNYLLIEALERYHHFYGDELKVECPVGSGNMLNLFQVAQHIRERLVNLFLPGAGNNRPCHNGDARFADDPHWKDLVLFYEYFHADTGRGVGATHQTGWTALAARCIEELRPEREAQSYPKVKQSPAVPDAQKENEELSTARG